MPYRVDLFHLTHFSRTSLLFPLQASFHSTHAPPGPAGQCYVGSKASECRAVFPEGLPVCAAGVKVTSYMAGAFRTSQEISQLFTDKWAWVYVERHQVR